MIDIQIKSLAKFCHTLGCDKPKRTTLPNGGVLVEIAGVRVEGWNRPTADILFLVPPGYPAGQPDCFWIEPSGFRLANGGTPQGTSDGNQIPGDVNPNRSTTWFSWHVQSWNPSRDTLLTYFKVIRDRLHPAR